MGSLSKAFYDTVRMVPQVKLKIKGGDLNEQ